MSIWCGQIPRPMLRTMNNRDKEVVIWLITTQLQLGKISLFTYCLHKCIIKVTGWLSAFRNRITTFLNVFNFPLHTTYLAISLLLFALFGAIPTSYSMCMRMKYILDVHTIFAEILDGIFLNEHSKLRQPNTRWTKMITYHIRTQFLREEEDLPSCPLRTASDRWSTHISNEI